MKKNKYNTKQKLELINVIKNYKKEFTIKDIYNELENVGLTTIYRFINDLVNEGMIVKRIEKDNICYYQYLEKCNNSNHFYLKCDKCGTMIHIDCDCINDLYSHIYNNHRFKLNKENIIINGICKKCGDK